ncbi:MAG: helix-turn-helix transcriptional regulator [Candidatus Omnitrophica bacterium]|nr:helix-turn-helix transcriptional regulator [Candidatus Omnitrophota bacterium]
MRKSDYPKDVKTMGQRIRKIRMDKGLSLLEVAKQVGITEGYLSRLEASKQKPSYPIAISLANVLDDKETAPYVNWSFPFDLKDVKKSLSKQILNLPMYSSLIQALSIFKNLKAQISLMPNTKNKQILLDLTKEGEEVLKNHCEDLGLTEAIKDSRKPS